MLRVNLTGFAVLWLSGYNWKFISIMGFKTWLVITYFKILKVKGGIFFQLVFFCYGAKLNIDSGQTDQSTFLVLKYSYIFIKVVTKNLSFNCSENKCNFDRIKGNALYIPVQRTFVVVKSNHSQDLHLYFWDILMYSCMLYF